MKIEGGCLCGKVRYSADAEPAFVGVCVTARIARRVPGPLFLVVGLPKPSAQCSRLDKDLRRVGAIAARKPIGAFARNAERHWIDEAEIMPDITMVLAGTPRRRELG